MKNKIWKILSYVLVAVIASVTTLLCFVTDQQKNRTKLDELGMVVDNYFIGEYDQAKLDDAAASAIVEALGDRWSFYMTAEEYKAYQDTMSNSYVGVGITVQIRQDGQGIDILEVLSGSPAEKAGLKLGDRIIAVDDTSLTDGNAQEGSELIRGEEGTTVSLTVVRGEEQKTFTVERKRFQSVVATGEMLGNNIGLVTIENFDARCAEETIAAIESLKNQGATSLIFDVRNNPGGYKDELVEVLDYLLPEGEIFRTEDYRGEVETDQSDAACLDMPMAVLVNLNSYSAAEFFAAALDDYDAAVVVGEKTYGKGYFQTAIPLSDGSAVNLSIGKYFTPKGQSLAGVGLTPEVEVIVDEETAASIYYGLLEPDEDPQIQAAVNALLAG